MNMIVLVAIHDVVSIDYDSLISSIQLILPEMTIEIFSPRIDPKQMYIF